MILSILHKAASCGPSASVDILAIFRHKQTSRRKQQNCDSSINQLILFDSSALCIGQKSACDAVMQSAPGAHVHLHSYRDVTGTGAVSLGGEVLFINTQIRSMRQRL